MDIEALKSSFKKVDFKSIAPKKKKYRYDLYNGDCLEKLKEIEALSVDAVVTDPPAGISFMNAEWDKDKGGRDEWIAWMTEVMKEVYRALKPGGHALVWAIPRTSHWTATAIEDAGFEIRDVVNHIFGSGFPKSMDVSKGIDKKLNGKRVIIRKGNTGPNIRGNKYCQVHGEEREQFDVTAPATDKAKEWDGWQTALKPAVEHWILARKPLEGGVVDTVLKYRTGALNIEGCRIPSEKLIEKGRGGRGECDSFLKSLAPSAERQSQIDGRWPAHLILSHAAACGMNGIHWRCATDCPIRKIDEQSGISTGSGKRTTKKRNSMGFHGGDSAYDDFSYSDSGGAARYFYCPKPSQNEKNAGLTTEGVKVKDGRKAYSDRPYLRGETLRKNSHPTVKSIVLMRYLARLITPPNGIVLDPFMGSGTTGVAAIKEGFRFVGIEKEDKFFKIAKTRIGDATL